MNWYNLATAKEVEEVLSELYHHNWDSKEEWKRSMIKMALINSKSLKTTLQIFFKENGREPDFNEFRNLISGRNAKEKQDETDSKQEKTQA